MAQDVDTKPAKDRPAPGSGQGLGGSGKGKAGARVGAAAGAAKAAQPRAGTPAGGGKVRAARKGHAGGAPLPAVDSGEKMRRGDLVAAVAAQTGMKRNEVARVVEATLAAIAEALTQGRQLALPPLGTARVSRTSEAGKSKVMVVRLRQGTKQAKAGKGGGSGKDGLADAGEAD